MRPSTLKLILTTVLLSAALAVTVLAADPPHYARAERYNEATGVVGDTLVCDANGDTTSSSVIKTVVTQNWDEIVIEFWHEGVAGTDSADTLEWQTRQLQFPGGTWSTWAILDSSKVPGTRYYKALSYVLRPYAVQVRAIAVVDTVGNKAVPKSRGWSQ